MDQQTTSARFPRRVRVRKPAEYKALFARGRRLRNPLLTVVCHANSSGRPRLGLAISKKAVPAASQRNRIKRQIREYFRLHQHQLRGYDLVFVAQAAANAATRHQLSLAVDSIWKQVLARCAES